MKEILGTIYQYVWLKAFTLLGLLEVILNAFVYGPRLVWWEFNGKGEKSSALIEDLVPRWANRVLRRVGAEVEVEGLENIPNGPVVVMSNHQSHFDVLLLLGNMGRVMGFVTKKELFRIPAFGFWMRQVRCASLDRSDPKAAARLYAELSRSIKEEGYGFIVFPEGTRSRDPKGTMNTFKQGSIRLATIESIPILPVSIDGSRFLVMPGPMFHSRGGGRKVRMKIGKVIDSTAKNAAERKVLLEKLYQVIHSNRESIQVLWPEMGTPSAEPVTAEK